jgi:NAD(P)H-dependent flavin oxidoreductase YrpB (nitropropane dioxygenase family)
MASNRLCELLGIRYPIVQAPMNWVSGAELAAAVSNAGGLGTLGPNSGAKDVTTDVAETGERLRDQIRKVKARTTKPFAVNIAVGVGEQRRYSQRCVEVAIEEGIAVAIVSVGSPDVYTKVLKEAGIKVLHAVSTDAHAKKAEAVGVDGVICEGWEAGGHKGFTELTTMTLIPMVADAVQIPIVAGGGIGDARGALAALVLGADGIYMGTRFMVTRESECHPLSKEAVVKAEGACTVSLHKDMMVARDLRNSFTQKYLELRAAGASQQELSAYLKDAQYRAQVLGDYDGAELCCGQVAGLIKSVVSAGEVIESIANGLPSALENARRKVAVFA